MSVEKLQEDNQLKNTVLTVGQNLVIKQEEKALEHIGSDICLPSEEVEKDKYDTYIVQEGDTLDSIAKKFQTTVSTLIYINGLHNTILTVGEKLLVPISESNGSISYLVKSGDTIYSIASNYNISPSLLMQKNQLKFPTLMVGQILKIPVLSSYKK